MSNLSRLLYISLAPASAGDQTAREIAAEAQQSNLAQGISGALLKYADFYLQVLEGEHDTVLALYERIRRDARHFSARTITFEPLALRQFAGWAMHHVTPPKAKDRAVAEFLRNLWRGLDAAQAHTALALMQRLAADANASSPSAVPAHH